MFDRVPKSAIDIEESLLSAVFLDSSCMDDISLSPEDFYSPKNSIVFRCFQNLSVKGKFDIKIVEDSLRKSGELDQLGGAFYLHEVASQISSVSLLENYVAIIKQYSISRKLITISSNVINMEYDNDSDVGDTLDYIEKELTEISTSTCGVSVSDMRSSIFETLKHYQDLQTKRQNNETVEITTGLSGLDKELSGGWSAPDLVILGGRPSMGKTELALHFAKKASSIKKNVLFVSIEMTKIQLITRILMEEENLSLYNLKTGNLTSDDWGMIDNKISNIENYSLNIVDDTRNLTDIKSIIRKSKRQYNTEVVVIDYLQLIKTTGKFGTRDIEIGHITGELKNLAKKLDLPIILLAQLNRPPKGVKVSTPKLEDLRESGNIEQDADIVIFIHRPTYYDEQAIDESGESWNNRGVLIISKNREGEKDKKVYFRHDDRFKKIFDYKMPYHNPNERTEVNLDF